MALLNVAMWGRALRVIPRISKDEWNHHPRSEIRNQ